MSVNLRTLVLNRNYMPISVFPLHTIPAEDAMTRLSAPATVRVVAEYDRVIKTQNPLFRERWPSIVARVTGKPIGQRAELSRDFLYYRDHGKCAYCAKDLTISKLTYDHVVPQCDGGPTTWENVVASCEKCNSAKGNLAAKGIWKPRQKPYKPDYWTLLGIRKTFPIVVADKQWIDFLGDWKGEIRVWNP